MTERSLSYAAAGVPMHHARVRHMLECQCWCCGKSAIVDADDGRYPTMYTCPLCCERAALKVRPL